MVEVLPHFLVDLARSGRRFLFSNAINYFFCVRLLQPANRLVPEPHFAVGGMHLNCSVLEGFSDRIHFEQSAPGSPKWFWSRQKKRQPKKRVWSIYWLLAKVALNSSLVMKHLEGRVPDFLGTPARVQPLEQLDPIDSGGFGHGAQHAGVFSEPDLL